MGEQVRAEGVSGGLGGLASAEGDTQCVSGVQGRSHWDFLGILKVFVIEFAIV